MSERKPLIVGNWKMNGNHLETIQMIQKLSYRLEREDYEKVDVVVAPPFTSLRSAQTVIEADRMLIQLGAQNTHWTESGAHTGEVSPTMLAKLSVGYVIVGHSERRTQLGETDEMVNKKVKAVHQAGMVPIVCVGESLEQRESSGHQEFVAGQVAAALKGLDVDSVAQTVVAYEPIWAIGSGRSAMPYDAAEMSDLIRGVLSDKVSGAASGKTRILYGGSVNIANIKDYMAKSNIDGALVGGASLDPDKFAAIVRYRL